MTLAPSDSTDETPLARFWRREIETGTQLLEMLRNDIQAILGYCHGEAPMTNRLRSLIADLIIGECFDPFWRVL